MSEDMQSNTLKDPLGSIWMIEKFSGTYDAITVLDTEMSNITGLGTFNSWYAERAAI
ncbi:MAG: hypothetical protein JHC33_13020 [Ignisphaera sp.]|nr:hypothetical protein [Ignisphaera sp.]